MTRIGRAASALFVRLGMVQQAAVCWPLRGIHTA
jgi:hypothetical protein